MMHQSVLLQESLDALAIKPDGVYVDGTFGRGGHSRAILQRLSTKGRLIAIDKDPAAIASGEALLKADPRLTLMQGSFSSLPAIATQLGVHGKIDGVLLDLGVSSPQLDDPARGFSFMLDGPLDMRMDLTQPKDAAYFVNHADVKEMAHIFKEYGEERFALRIARAIEKARAEQPIVTTKVLAEIVKAANPKWEKHKHPATRVFQAIRIHVNQELNDLAVCLNGVIDALAIGGRLAVISFHSLEDRIVKQFMRDKEQGSVIPAGVPIRASERKTSFKRVGKAIKPSDLEVSQNVRARSAILRIGEKTA